MRDDIIIIIIPNCVMSLKEELLRVLIRVTRVMILGFEHAKTAVYKRTNFSDVRSLFTPSERNPNGERGGVVVLAADIKL